MTARTATPAQINYLRNLDQKYLDRSMELATLQDDGDKIVYLDGIDRDAIRDYAAIDFYKISSFIDTMKMLVAKIGAELRDVRAAERAERAVDAAVAAGRPALTVGVYVVGDDVFKVIRAVHGTGGLYAKRLDPTDRTPKGNARFVYGRGAISRIKPENKMTLADATRFGALYGVCVNCGRTLTDDTSIERSMGPRCASRFA